LSEKDLIKYILVVKLNPGHCKKSADHFAPHPLHNIDIFPPRKKSGISHLILQDLCIQQAKRS